MRCAYGGPPPWVCMADGEHCCVAHGSSLMVKVRVVAQVRANDLLMQEINTHALMRPHMPLIDR